MHYPLCCTNNSCMAQALHGSGGLKAGRSAGEQNRQPSFGVSAPAGSPPQQPCQASVSNHLPLRLPAPLAPDPGPTEPKQNKECPPTVLWVVARHLLWRKPLGVPEQLVQPLHLRRRARWGAREWPQSILRRQGGWNAQAVEQLVQPLHLRSVMLGTNQKSADRHVGPNCASPQHSLSTPQASNGLRSLLWQWDMSPHCE